MEAYGKAPAPWKRVVLWVVKGLLFISFISAGAAKLYGVPMMVENFDRIGAGQWFRYVTGALEVLGAVILLLPGKAAFGAVLLVCIMIGATITHLAIIGGSAVPAIVLLALAAFVAFSHRDQLLDVVG